MARQLTKFGPAILKLLAPLLTKEFGKIIHNYDESFRRLKGIRGDIEGHTSLCSSVFRTVLTRGVDKFDIFLTSAEFLRIIIVETLDSVPELLEFSITPALDNKSALLASKIHHLTKLQVFKYFYYCTDEIILQLRLNCPHLRVVDISESREVTNASVQHLIQLRELKYLDVGRTQIDDDHYGLILSRLPSITNIVLPSNRDLISRHITVGRLHTVTRISIYVHHINGLAQKCPNVTNITLTNGTSIMSESGFAAFSALRVLKFEVVYYDISNMNAVLRAIGHRLTHLEIARGVGLNLQDITTLCPSLVNLTMEICMYLELDVTLFDRNLPHFRNLINLNIDGAFAQVDFSFIRYYVNLKTLVLKKIDVFTVEFVREVIALGTLKKLELLELTRVTSGNSVMEVIRMMIEHCPFLKRIKGLQREPCLKPEFIRQLEDEIKSRNFDLEIED
jgi:hypothetical protein